MKSILHRDNFATKCSNSLRKLKKAIKSIVQALIDFTSIYQRSDRNFLTSVAKGTNIYLPSTLCFVNDSPILSPGYYLKLDSAPAAKKCRLITQSGSAIRQQRCSSARNFKCISRKANLMVENKSNHASTTQLENSILFRIRRPGGLAAKATSQRHERILPVKLLLRHCRVNLRCALRDRETGSL